MKPVATLMTLCGMVVAGPVCAAPQNAGMIPLIVTWEGEPPIRVTYLDGNGTNDLTKQRDGTFRRDIPRASQNALYEQRTIMVQYRDHTIPLIINVKPAAQKVEFRLSLTVPKSCYDYYLKQAELPPTNADDAMRRMLSVAYMIEIPDNNGCRAVGFEARAKRVRLDRNANLSSSYKGVIAVNDDWKKAVVDLPPDALPNTRPDQVASAAGAIGTTALVTGIYREDMRDASDAAASLAIADKLAELRDRDPVVATALRNAPLDADRAMYRDRVGRMDAAAPDRGVR